MKRGIARSVGLLAGLVVLLGTRLPLSLSCLAIDSGSVVAREENVQNAVPDFVLSNIRAPSTRSTHGSSVTTG